MTKPNGADTEPTTGRDLEAEMERLAARMDQLKAELAGEPSPEEKAREERERRIKLQQDRDRREAEMAERAVEFYRSDLGPRHQAAVRDIASALRTLEAAIVAEEALHQELRPYGYHQAGRFHLMPWLGFPACGRLSDPNSGVSRWFAWARQKGYQVDEPSGGEPEPVVALVEQSEPQAEPKPAPASKPGPLSAFRRRRANGQDKEAANG